MFCRNSGGDPWKGLPGRSMCTSYFPSNFAHLCFLFLVKYFNNAVFDHDIAMSDNVKTSAANSEKQGCRVHEDCLCLVHQWPHIATQEPIVMKFNFPSGSKRKKWIHSLIVSDRRRPRRCYVYFFFPFHQKDDFSKFCSFFLSCFIHKEILVQRGFIIRIVSHRYRLC